MYLEQLLCKLRWTSHFAIAKKKLPLVIRSLIVQQQIPGTLHNNVKGKWFHIHMACHVLYGMDGLQGADCT